MSNIRSLLNHKVNKIAYVHKAYQFFFSYTLTEVQCTQNFALSFYLYLPCSHFCIFFLQLPL